MKYRTPEQWKDITENMVNGNWSDAGKLCAEAGFYANDLRKYQEQDKAEGINIITDDFDFCELLEIANRFR